MKNEVKWSGERGYRQNTNSLETGTRGKTEERRNGRTTKLETSTDDDNGSNYIWSNKSKYL
jgi:hypothetical protein